MIPERQSTECPNIKLGVNTREWINVSSKMETWRTERGRVIQAVKRKRLCVCLQQAAAVRTVAVPTHLTRSKEWHAKLAERTHSCVQHCRKTVVGLIRFVIDGFSSTHPLIYHVSVIGNRCFDLWRETHRGCGMRCLLKACLYVLLCLCIVKEKQ